MSPTFKRERGYTFKIYSNEEERIHVHVVKDNDEAKLEPQIELANNYGFSEKEINVITKIIQNNADTFREQYKQHISKRVDD